MLFSLFFLPRMWLKVQIFRKAQNYVQHDFRSPDNQVASWRASERNKHREQSPGQKTFVLFVSEHEVIYDMLNWKKKTKNVFANVSVLQCNWREQLVFLGILISTWCLALTVAACSLVAQSSSSPFGFSALRRNRSWTFHIMTLFTTSV